MTRRELRLLIALFVLSLPAVTSRLYSSDEVQYFSYLRSLWFDRDVSFDNEYRDLYERGVARTPGFEQTFLVPFTPTGLRENFATMGCAILWAPFYGLADILTRTLGTRYGLPADGYSRLYVAAVAYGSAIYGFAAVLLAIGVARRLTGSGVFAGLVVWIGTPLLFYMYAAPPFSHACSAFAVAVFITMWLRVREHWSPRGAMALGAAAAVMTMVREQDVFYAAAPVIDFFLWAAARFRERAGSMSSGELRRTIGAAAGGVAAFLIAYAPQLFAYVALNGRPGPSGLVSRKMMWMAPHALGVLASTEHGLLAWTPLALLAIGGLLHLWITAMGDPRGSDRRRVAGCLLLMLTMQVYVSGSVGSWTVAGAFGQRRFVGATILLVIGIAAFWRALAAGWARGAAASVIALMVWWNVGLTALFGAGMMDRQRLSLGRNAYDVFVTLPRMAPSLVYRYLFDRRSFYKSPATGVQ